MAIKQLVGDAPRRTFIGQFKGLGTKPLHADHRDDLLRENAWDGGGGLKVLTAVMWLFVLISRQR